MDTLSSILGWRMLMQNEQAFAEDPVLQIGFALNQAE